MTDELTDAERAILDFEGTFWRYPGCKDDAIRQRFDITAVRYAQRVNALLQRPAALAYAPTTVKRLRRLRDARRHRQAWVAVNRP